MEDQEKAYTGSPIMPDYEITGSHTASGFSRTLTFTYEGIDGTVYGPAETFRIYPNPVSKNSKLIIDNGQLIIDNERTFVEVYNMNGSLLRKIEVRDSKMEIRSESREGVYLYIVRSNKETMPIAKIKVVLC